MNINMSNNQCSYLFNQQSFSLYTQFNNTPLNPSLTTTTFRPVFTFHNCFRLFGKRPRCRTLYNSLPLAARSSSSDIVLIATTEHRDGSLVFRFGDASELVKNEDVVKEVESLTEQEVDIVKVLDGDQESQMIINTVEEVDDGIRNADIDSGVDEKETNVISELKEEEALSLQPDAKYLKILEGTVDEIDSTCQHDGDESSSLTISLVDDIGSPNKDKNENSEETLLKKSHSENEDLAVSVKLEAEGDFDMVRIENINTRDLEDVELAVSANEYVEEELTDKLINDSTLIDKMLPSDTLNVELTVAASEDVVEELNEGVIIDEMRPPDTLDAELMTAASKDAEEDLKNSNINEGILIDEMLPPDTSDVESAVYASEDGKEELKDTSINEGILIDEMPPSDTSDVELMVSASEDAEEELKDTNIDENPLSTMLDGELMVAASVEVEKELKNKNINQSTLIDEMSPSDTLDVKLTVVGSEDAEEELKDTNINEGFIVDEMTPSDTSDVELTVTALEDVEEELKDTNMCESTLADEIPPSDALDAELAVAESDDVEEGVKDTNISESTLIDEMLPSDTLDVEVTVSASVEELRDTCINESTLIDEMLPSDRSDAKLTVSSSEDGKEELIDMNIGEATLIDEMPSSDLLAIEPTLFEVSQIQLHVNVEEKIMDISSTESVDVQDQAMEDELQQVGTENKVFNVPVSNLEEAEPVLDIELQGQTSDESANEESEDPSVSVKLEVMDVTQPYSENEFPMEETGDTSESDMEDLLPPCTMHISDAKQTDDVNEEIGDAILIDGLLPYDALGVEPTSEEVSQIETTMEVWTTKSMDVEDQASENELPKVSSDNSAENDIANMMHAEPTLAEEVISLAINADAGGGYMSDAEQSSSHLEPQPVQDGEVNNSTLKQYLENESLESSILLVEGAIDPLLKAERNEDIINSIGLVEASADTALLLADETEVLREEIYITGDFFSSGAALLEHPSKALTGGDDAYFVVGGKWLGVANGVNQWSFEGTDPGVFAQELMKTCEEIVLDNSSVPITNPVELICKGVKETNMSGSSNVLIANFDGQALHVANIGDTGFLIIRHGAVYKKSSPLLHEFHFALQVEDCDDLLQLVEEHTIELEEGDLVVSATDGLFDNLYEREIAMIVSKSFQAGMKPEEIANILATRAQEVGRSALVRSPFSDAAQAAGYTGYAGGKPDNVAVIVSLVEKRSILGTG